MKSVTPTFPRIHPSLPHQKEKKERNQIEKKKKEESERSYIPIKRRNLRWLCVGLFLCKEWFL
jgi:hypothetical protein